MNTMSTRVARKGLLAGTLILAGLGGLSLQFGAPVVSGGEANASQRPISFTRDIKPILAARCTGCHGVKIQEGGLRLDRREAAVRGGESGEPAIVPGKSNESSLLERITTDDADIRMPLDNTPLSDEQFALLREWIDQGAFWPAGANAEKHWSFVKPLRPKLPPVTDASWPRNGIDYFILAKLEKEDVAPAPVADRTTLIRRVSLDLTGLPPTLEEVDAFVHDESPGAYERLVDRLLASPHYGERWGRFWLDLARYADSNGYTRDFARQIWKYRDWVIGAFNRDMPFDRFSIQQIAGDMLPDATLDQIVATGFHRNTLINEEGGTDQEQFRVEAVADRVNTTGAVFLGLTLGCARCHDHKYDPISQPEYYQLFAFLNNCDEPTIDAPSAAQVALGELKRRDEIRAGIADLEKKLQAQRGQLEAKQAAWEKALSPEQKATYPGPVQEALMVLLEKRTPAQKKMVERIYRRTNVARVAFPLVDQIAKLRASEPKIPTTMVMRRREEPRTTHVHRRGNFLDKAEQVPAAVPVALHPLPKDLEQPNRLDFARWLVDAENPLTSRVVMNRFWQRFFGRGIVDTENDFGTQGSPPTHPELLDWLATELMARDWGIKAMHRLIVTSATYQQASRNRPELAEVDPRNYWLARQSRLRLDAEIVRDTALSTGGLLTRTVGGPSVYPPQPAGVFEFTQDPKPWITEQGNDRFRRGMYTYFWRSSPYPALVVFDMPNGNVTCTRRVRSNTPLQSLTLANDVTFVECAQNLAKRVLSEGPDTDSDRARFAFRLCMARQPSPAENALIVKVLNQQRAQFQADPEAAGRLVGSQAPDSADVAELAAWTACSRVLLNLDEFITRE